MGNKIQSEILRIELADASYKGTNTSVEPTYVNFFFGNNGTGKSTIAKAITSGVGVTYVPGRVAEDYLPLVYNQDFIDANFRSYHNMRGVFTLNEKNAAIQQQIDIKTEARNVEQKALKTASEQRVKKDTAREKLEKEFHLDCWGRGKDIREEFEKTQGGKGRSKPFTMEILKYLPQNIDLEELRRLYDSAYSDTAKRYARFNTVSEHTVLDSLEGNDILSTIIVNSSNTELAEFLRKIGATQWMRQGHSNYSQCADGQCPYCGQELPIDFEQTVTDSFDNLYQHNLQKLDSFIALYRQKANDLYVPLETLPSEVYPQIDTKPYTDKLSVLKAAIQSNIEAIKEKREEPAKAAVLTETSPILLELSNIIDGFNSLIDANNAIVDAGPKKKNECTELVFTLLAFQLKDVI